MVYIACHLVISIYGALISLYLIVIILHYAEEMPCCVVVETLCVVVTTLDVLVRALDVVAVTLGVITILLCGSYTIMR